MACGIRLPPFAGSNVTGEVAERLQRRWLAFDLVEEYLEGSRFRFPEAYHQGYMFGQQQIGSTGQVTLAAGQSEEASVEQPRLLEPSVEYPVEEDIEQTE